MTHGVREVEGVLSFEASELIEDTPTRTEPEDPTLWVAEDGQSRGDQGHGALGSS